MGQYWIPVNLDKHETIDPHRLGAGLKLWEQLVASTGTSAALVILLAAEREMRGGGDFDLPDHEELGDYGEVAKRTIGRWAGDRIAFVGDYAEESDLPAEFHAQSLYDRARNDYTDITEDVARVIEHELGGHYEGGGWRTFVESEA